MRVLICGGGTAGHIMPGIAIAEYIKECDGTSEIMFVGRKNGQENSLILNAGFPLETIEISGFRRSLSPKNISTALKTVIALGKAFKILRAFAPDVTVGTGGYVCWPIIKMAQLMKIPTVIHESNAYPGLTTRMLASKCDKVLLNLEECKAHLKRIDNTLVVGNPLRNTFIKGTRAAARKKLKIADSDIFILSFGGSGGSDVMNSHLISLMKAVSEKNRRIRHLHATGKKYYDTAAKSSPELIKASGRCRIVPFIEDMPAYMLAADIVISRAGAMTLSEISAAGVASILIPSPNVTDNHQYKNAKAYESVGGAIVILESELNDEILAERVIELIQKRRLRRAIADAARGLHVQNSLHKICTGIEAVKNRKKQ
ncbi:MAG: undecaprenyldiphospho-muramoylpentapeptide beta-N-acetylglucosaminyltransferase [Clostridia bacterium]|nr:undecaprenyldiphospho-muramoylpentapeptide beta-N-acetylglucosaminyltransferase [Clostridia bacterium]